MIFVFNIYLRLDPTSAGADVTAASRWLCLSHCVATLPQPSDCFCGVSEDRCLAHPHVCLLHTLSVFLWRISGAIDQRWHRLSVTCLGILILTKGFGAERVAGAAWSISIWTVACVVFSFMCFYIVHRLFWFSVTRQWNVCVFSCSHLFFVLCRKTKQFAWFLCYGF